MNGTRLPRVRAELSSVGFRVLITMLALMFAGLALAGTVTHTIEFYELDRRIDQTLMEKARQVQKLQDTDAEIEAEDLSVDQRLQEIAEDLEPSKHEVWAALVGGRIIWKHSNHPDADSLPGSYAASVAALSSPAGIALGSLGGGNDLIRLAIVPVGLSSDPGAAHFVIATDLGEQREPILVRIRTYAMVSMGTLLVSGLLGSLISGRLLRPLRLLREATELVSPEDMSQRVDVRQGGDDVAQLVRTFNTMLQRLDEGVRDQQQFMDDAGHELRTPLTIIRGHLELMSAEDPHDVQQTRELLLDELDRMQRLVDDLLLLANAKHPDFVRPEEILVADFTSQVMDKIRVLGDRRWQMEATADGVITADPQRLTQAVVQLAANAVKYTDSTSAIGFGTRIERGDQETVGDTARPDILLLWIRDTGTGIRPEDQGRIFDRFGRASTGRGVGGSGLGLAIVTAIANAHGGGVSIRSVYGQGSVFTVHIPLQRWRVTV
jgi:two-component system OmpR family sensor kinase